MMPVLLLRPWLHGEPPSEVSLGLRVCEPWSRHLEPADVLSDEGWPPIVTVFTLMGKAVPDRAITCVRWESVS